jgi:hypothetical protein
MKKQTFHRFLSTQRCLEKIGTIFEKKCYFINQVSGRIFAQYYLEKSWQQKRWQQYLGNNQSVKQDWGMVKLGVPLELPISSLFKNHKRHILSYTVCTVLRDV